MSRVMELQLPSKQKFVLLCIANNADDFGASFPSVASLSRDSCIPERTIQRLIGWLTDENYIVPYWDYHPNDRLRRKKIRFLRLNLSGKPITIKPDYSNCPTALRQEVIQRFNKTCSYCGDIGDDKRGPDKKAWEIDRIVPGSKGGGYVADNVTLSCGPCNRTKGANLAPLEMSKLAPQGGAIPANLGAILDAQGCQNEQAVVPMVAHYPSDQPSDQPSVKPPSPAMQVFERWKQKLDHPKAVLDEKRLKAINARLRNGYSVEDLFAAIDGLTRSSHHMGRNDRGQVYDDIELVCRDAAHVESFIAKAAQSSAIRTRAATTVSRPLPEGVARWNCRACAFHVLRNGSGPTSCPDCGDDLLKAEITNGHGAR